MFYNYFGRAIHNGSSFEVYNLYNSETWRLLISISQMRAYKLSGLVSMHYFSIMPPFN